MQGRGCALDLNREIHEIHEPIFIFRVFRVFRGLNPRLGVCAGGWIDVDLNSQKASISAHLINRGRLTRMRKEVRSMTEIKLKKGEPVDRALRRLKKKVDREGTLKVVRNHRHFEKPSERRRRKEKAARFSAMLTARYADL